MNVEKYIIGIVTAASLIGTGMMSWEMGRNVAEREEQRHQRVMNRVRGESATSTALRSPLAPPQKVPSLSDWDVKKYYLCHVSEFQPLPHSPFERAKVWKEIDLQIRQKLALTAPQTAQNTTAPTAQQES